MQTVLLALLTVLVSVLLAVLGLRLVRRQVDLSILEAHHEVAGFFISVIAVMYGVVLAFAVLVVWTQFDEARVVAEQEATQLRDLFWMAEGFPTSVRQQAQETMRAYARAVVDEEWSAMERGEQSPTAVTALDELRRIFLTMEPGTPREGALYAESLARLNDLSDSRTERLLASRHGVPLVVWSILITGGLVTVIFTYFFGVRSVRSQTLMTAALTASIALILFLIAVLNYPFRGDTRVPPESFEYVLERMEGALGRDAIP